MPSPRFESHEEYIASVPEAVRPVLHAIQSQIEARVPGAVRCVGYNMPAYQTGKTFLYFAAFKNHIGVYPPVAGDDAMVRALAPYRNEKGNLAFPLAQPIPVSLIGDVAVALARERGEP